MRRAVFAILFLALPVAAQESITPDQLWSAMQQGNRQFVAGKVVYDNLKAEREMLKASQYPPITVLACSDSRVPPELVFNQSLGGLFVVRTAANVADELGLASVEFAISNGWTKLLVVLAHDDCGAIRGSLGGGDPASPSLLALAKRIRSSFVGIPYDTSAANVRKATEANARAAAAQLLAGSAMVRDAVATNGLKVVTAFYETSTGEVKKIE